MTLDRISRWRRWAGIAGSIFCLLSLLAVIDALVARFKQPLSLFQVLPGTVLDIQGPLREAVDTPQKLSFQCDSQEIRIDFEGVQTGYWLGGYLWRGRLVIGPETRPGLYSLKVLSPGKAATPPFPPFQIRVFGDPVTYRRNLPSLVQRYSGVGALGGGGLHFYPGHWILCPGFLVVPKNRTPAGRGRPGGNLPGPSNGTGNRNLLRPGKGAGPRSRDPC